MKKLMAAVLALTMIAAMAVPACADNTISTAGGTSTVPVTLTTTAATFSVTVPTAFPISVAADGDVTCADNLMITNNSNGQIKVSGVQLTGKNGWSLVDFTTDFAKKAANTKEFGFKLQGINVPSSGRADISSFTAIDGNTSLDVIYDATVAVQASALTDSEIASVVFTIGWNT